MGPRPRKPSGPAVMTAQTGRTQDCTRPSMPNPHKSLATREPSTQDIGRAAYCPYDLVGAGPCRARLSSTLPPTSRPARCASSEGHSYSACRVALQPSRRRAKPLGTQSGALRRWAGAPPLRPRESRRRCLRPPWCRRPVLPERRRETARRPPRLQRRRGRLA